MKKKKKIVETESTKTTSGVKFKTTNLKKVQERKKEEESRRNSTGNRYKIPQGRSLLYILPPTSDEMNGIPYVESMTHSNIGPENKFLPCMRRTPKEDRSKCLMCVQVGKYWDKARAYRGKDEKLNKKYYKMATEQGLKIKKMVQILDVSGLYDKKGKVDGEFPKCFGENVGTEDEKYKACRTCPLLSSCQKGVQTWEMQFGAEQAFMLKLNDEETDPTDIQNPIPIKIFRKGEGKEKTEYSFEWGNSFTIPPHVIKFLEKNAKDLTTMLKVSTEEQVNSALSGGETVESGESSKVKKKIKVKEVVKSKVSKEQREDMKRRLKAMSEKKKKNKE